MLDDPREAIGAALKWKGRSVNATDPFSLALATRLLLEQKPLVRTYNSSNFEDVLLSGDVWVAQGWNGQFARALAQDPDLAYVIPNEGGSLFIDSLVIPRSAPHPELAHAFMDFVMEAEVAAEICATMQYSTPNRAAMALLPESLRRNPAVFPSDEEIARLELIHDIGEATLDFDRAWTEVKTRRRRSKKNSIYDVTFRFDNSGSSSSDRATSRKSTTKQKGLSMQFIDLAFQQRRIREKIEKGILSVLDHGQYIMGPEIKQLETQLAQYCGVRHAVSCASGTDALLLALMAYGIGPGDAVFTSPFTFIATAEVIQLLGGTPVFVDIDLATFNIDPNLLAAAIEAVEDGRSKNHPLPERSKGPLTPKAVIAVDLFGLPADYPRINRIANKYGAIVIEDAAQSFGAELDGKKACSLAAVGCTSFFPAKPLGCYGDGGMCFTDDAQLATVMDSLRVHGKGTDKYDNVRIGINGRMDTLQAAIVLSKFSIFPEEVEMPRRSLQSAEIHDIF